MSKGDDIDPGGFLIGIITLSILVFLFGCGCMLCIRGWMSFHGMIF